MESHGLNFLCKVALLLQAIRASAAYAPSATALYMSNKIEEGVPVGVSSSKPFAVVQVDNRDLYYGVLVFRHRHIRLDDYQAQNNNLSRNDALMALTQTKCDDTGQDLWFSGGERGLLTQFAAIMTTDMDDHDDDYLDITNAVIGAADIHLRSLERDKLHQVEIEVKNVRVESSFRRQGVGTTLLDKIQNHVRRHHPSAKVYLDVDIDNLAARTLYQSKGFQDDPMVMGKMIWKLGDDSSLT